MQFNADRALDEILKHEGGFVNHPDDPGGATNRGVTIGTLKRLGMDLDGDGDVDVSDLMALTHEDAKRVFKRFYWDVVQADLLPSGIDYTVADFAVNAGPSRAAKHLQKALGVTQDGAIGPQTLAAARAADAAGIVMAVNTSRINFKRTLRHWSTFGRGWTRRVEEVTNLSLELIQDARANTVPTTTAPSLIAKLIARLFSKAKGA